MTPNLLIHFSLFAKQDTLLVAVWLIGVVAAIIFLTIFFKFGFLWLRAFASGAKVGMASLIGMWLRKVSPNIIVNNRIIAVKAGLKEITTDILEAHYLARGNVPKVIRALIAASRANIPLTFQRAAAIDLAGRDVLEAVQTSVNPKVIDCPEEGKRSTIDAVAQDGIQVKVRARVTVRANIERLVGGATEETIIARIGEGIVTTIGSSETYAAVLENPDSISKKVLEKGLDSGTAFEILSIDIADIDIGNNIGARLQADQAEADKKIAQAKAEERRAMAVAKEHEMQAQVQENQAKVVLAEAEIPKAIAEAFNSGKMGLMNYYKLRNIMADTTMRSSIAGESNVGFKM